jgi:hypothetical protein
MKLTEPLLLPLVIPSMQGGAPNVYAIQDVQEHYAYI